MNRAVGPAPPEITPLPSPYDLRDVLAGLLGHDLEVHLTDPYAPESGRTTYAVYVDDRLRTRAVLVADLAWSACAATAIALLPPTTAQRTVADGVLDEMLVENLREVLNVCAVVLNADGAPHVRLHEVYALGPPPSDVAAFACVPAQRLDLEVRVPRYGVGRLSVVSLP